MSTTVPEQGLRGFPVPLGIIHYPGDKQRWLSGDIPPSNLFQRTCRAHLCPAVQQDLISGETGFAQRQTASASLQQLEKTGILESRRVGREKIFIHPALLKNSFRAMRICRKFSFFSTRSGDMSIGSTGPPPIHGCIGRGGGTLVRKSFFILPVPE